MKQLEDIILVQIDCEKGEGVELKKKYSIKGYPTFILANAEAEAYYRWMGYSKELLIKKMKTGFSDLTTITEKQKRYQKKPDAKTAVVLAEYSGSKAEYKDANLGDSALSDNALFEAMAHTPKLIERPIVINGEKARSHYPAISSFCYDPNF